MTKHVRQGNVSLGMLLLLVAALAAGCQGYVTVSITSEPSGAQVRIDGTDFGKTPAKGRVRWNTTRFNKITLEHPECLTFTTVLRRTTPQYTGGQLYLALLFYPIGIPVMLASRGPVTEQHFILAPRQTPDSEPPDPESRNEGSAGGAPVACARLPLE
jgi:hypothetical protein